MFSKFWKASLCFSAAYTLAPHSPFSPIDKVFTEPQKEEKRLYKKDQKLAQLLAERNRLEEMQLKTPSYHEAYTKEKYHFFEKPVLEGFSKIALYHLFGFIGYFPYVSTVAGFFMLPLIPFNLITDGSLLYMYTKNLKEFKVQDKTWDKKEFLKMVDYMSYAFGFVSAGGVAKGVPAYLGMMASMYVYTRLSGDKFNRNEAILAGALGATIPMFALSYTYTFSIGRKVPFVLGTFLIYGALSTFVCTLLSDYMANRSEDKISSMLLSSYKWSYIGLMGLWKFCGSE